TRPTSTICAKVGRGRGKPPTVAAVSSDQRNAYQRLTSSLAARASVASTSRPATIAPSRAIRRMKCLSSVDAAPPERLGPPREERSGYDMAGMRGTRLRPAPRTPEHNLVDYPSAPLEARLVAGPPGPHAAAG